jgi:hypothetical protein
MNFIEEVVLNGIREVFELNRIKYICVANEHESDKPIPRLHIQILLLKQPKSKNIKKSLLTKYLCMYRLSPSHTFNNQLRSITLLFFLYSLVK